MVNNGMEKWKNILTLYSLNFANESKIIGTKSGKFGTSSINNKLKFVGEYLNGERNGKGKEYYCDGKLKFQGEYLNGERNEKWKEYNSDGNLVFEKKYSNKKKK